MQLDAKHHRGLNSPLSSPRNSGPFLIATQHQKENVSRKQNVYSIWPSCETRRVKLKAAMDWLEEHSC